MEKMRYSVASNTIIRDGRHFVDGLVRNLLDADIDEILFLDGGSTDGTYERLIEWADRKPQIQVLSWRQPDKRAFASGFREPTRRNLLRMVSTTDYILYIDADERISVNLKQHLCGATYYAVPMLHLWGNGIRLDTADDRVWNSQKVRLFLRNAPVEFRATHASGLHCQLCRWGIGVEQSSTRVKRSVRALLGLEPVGGPRIAMWHLHYYDLNMTDDSDLRWRDIAEGALLRVGSALDALAYDRRREHVICVRDLNAEEQNALQELLLRWGPERV